MVYEPNVKIEINYSSLIHTVLTNCLKAFACINNDILREPELNKNTVRKTVLVIDDEEEIRNILSDILEKEGLKVILAASGEEGMDIYRTSKPDLVLLDVSLPNMNGFAVLKCIKEINALASVYFITGVAGENFIRQTKELGAKGHLPKPFYSKDIVNLVRSEFI